MNADAAFVTGKTHRVCQDYARADPKNGLYVIVSDGCSSAPDTDFGARLLVKSIENAVLDPKSVDPLEEMQYTLPATFAPFNGIANAKAAARMLQLSEYALDATLLFARYDETKLDIEIAQLIKVTVFGDGVVAAINKETGDIEAFHVEFPTGYPQYLSYRLSSERQARLAKLDNANQPVVTKWIIKKNGEAELQGDKFDTSNDFQLFIFRVDKYNLVGTFSDGVGSFTDANLQTVPWQKIVAEMMDVPARKGEFVQRQMNWMVKELAKRKWTHSDDFSMGAINI